MSERSWLVGVIALGSALVATSMLWSSRSTSERLDALQRDIASLRAACSSASVRPRRAPHPVPVKRPAAITQAEFDAAWRGSGAQALAEETCWAPADRAQRMTDPSPHFELTVAVDGAIADISFDPRAEELFPGIYPCVAKALATLRLAPGRERRGAVQVTRAPVAP